MLDRSSPGRFRRCRRPRTRTGARIIRTDPRSVNLGLSQACRRESARNPASPLDRLFRLVVAVRDRATAAASARRADAPAALAPRSVRDPRVGRRRSWRR